MPEEGSVRRVLTSRLPLFLKVFKYLVSKWIHCEPKNYHPSDYFVIPTVRIYEKKKKSKEVEEQALLAIGEGKQREEGTQSRKVKVRKAMQPTISCLELSFPLASLSITLWESLKIILRIPLSKTQDFRGAPNFRGHYTSAIYFLDEKHWGSERWTVTSCGLAGH